MITKELVDFIRKMRLEGHTNSEIESLLTSNGWLSVDVMEAFHSIDAVSKNIQTPIPSPITPTAPVMHEMPINLNQKVYGFTPPIVATMPIRKSHKGLITFFVILFLVLASGVSAYFYRDNLKNLPLVKNFFPTVEVPQVVVDIPVPIVPTPDLNIDTNTKAAIDCLSEIKARDVTLDTSKVGIVAGKIEFINSDFPYSSLTVSAGIFDEATVKPDGSFCLEINNDVSTALITVSPISNTKDTKPFLAAMSSPDSVKNGLIINPESTAISLVDISYAPFFSDAENNNIIKLIKTLPEGRDYIQSVIAMMNFAKKGFSLSTVTSDSLIVKKIKILHDALQKSPSTTELPNPIFDKQKATNDRQPLLRDINRVTQIEIFKSSLEAYKSIIGPDYPKSLEEMKTSNMVAIPVAPTPNDGKCTVAQNTFVYKYSPGSYNVSFCLGQLTQINGVQYTAGVHILTPAGIK